MVHTASEDSVAAGHDEKVCWGSGRLDAWLLAARLRCLENWAASSPRLEI